MEDGRWKIKRRLLPASEERGLAYHDAEGFSTAGIDPTAIPDDVRAIDDAAILTFLLRLGFVL